MADGTYREGQNPSKAADVDATTAVVTPKMIADITDADPATETTLAAILLALADPATETTLADLLVSIGAPDDAAYTGSGDATVISALKGIYALLAAP